MKMKSTIAIAISAVMLFTNMGSLAVFADDVTINDTTSGMIENCQGVSDVQRKDYILPYSFDEFLALSDEEFLALEDVPQSAKEYYESSRGYDSWGLGVVYFQFHDGIDFGAIDSYNETQKKEICEFLNVPSEIVLYFQDQAKYFGYGDMNRIIVKNEEYNGYSAEFVANKLEIYLHFHEAIFISEIDLPAWVPDFILGDIDLDGELGVTDVVILQKWLLGSGELQNWQSADIHQDGIINIYDLMLLKRMVIGE